ncbi:PREDICTED: protein FAM71D [Chaetura pelagica]|uniref:protein FAM71D n=1 Tax=Chaetura pelagica TaxID=8897 RepID=UPI000523A1B3|nr:PREDICTED: protein FAM71D [Chaetura pelagica]
MHWHDLGNQGSKVEVSSIKVEEKMEGKMDSKFDFKGISSSQTSIMGDLRRLLNQGEYSPFTCAPIFESKFVEVNQRGERISIHNRTSCVTIGICAASPGSPLPNAMLVAREVSVSPQESVPTIWKASEQPSQKEQLELTRFLPLELVELAVHSRDHHHLMIKLVNGRSYYLELCAPPDQQEHLFHLWLQLISLLKPPENTNNTKVDVKEKDLGMCHEKAPSPNNPPENRDDPQDVPNPETEKEEITEQAPSIKVPLPAVVDATDKTEKERETFHGSLPPTQQENTKQPKNKSPVDKQRSKSTEKRKPRTNTTKKKSEKKVHTSGYQKSASKSSRLLHVLSRAISKKV